MSNLDSWAKLSGLRLSWAGVVAYPASSTFGPRRLHDFELVWVLDGAARMYYDGVCVDAKRDTMILARPGMVDRYEWHARGRSRQAYLHFELDRLERGWPPYESWPLSRQLAEDDLLKPLYRFCLTWDHDAGPKLPLPYRDALELMVKAFVGRSSALASEPFEQLPAPVERALAYVAKLLEQRPVRSPSLRELAKVAGVSAEHLCRLFTRYTGHGPLETYRLARLERAAGLLGNTVLSIKEIAERVGYGDQYQFSRSFKAVYGASPRKYREQVEAGEPGFLSPAVRLLNARVKKNVR